MNNTVIITGASAGIGKALAYEFARHNYDLLLVARSEDKLKKLCKELGESYGITTRSRKSIFKILFPFLLLTLVVSTQVF